MRRIGEMLLPCPQEQELEEYGGVFLYTGHIRAGEMAERLKAAVC
jgi:hypothetical protein